MSVYVIQDGVAQPAKYLLILTGGVVVNKIIAFEGFWPEEGFTAIETTNEPGSPGIGWTFDGQVFHPPEESIE